jgi:serine/threonine-protein kinase
VLVPDLRDRGPVEAVEAALRAGLRPSVTAEPGVGRTAGKILRQSPEPGTTAHKGDALALVVATGLSSSAVEIPDVLGLTIGEAVLKIAQAGLTTQVVRLKIEGAPAKDADRVAAQSAVGRFDREIANPVRVFVLE